MSIRSRSSSYGGWSRARGIGAHTLAPGRAYRACELCNRVRHHRLLLIPFACGLGCFHDLPVLPPIRQSHAMLARSAASERPRVPFRRYYLHHSHPAVAGPSVSLCCMFNGVEQAHAWLKARTGVVLHHRPAHRRRSNFAMNEAPQPKLSLPL